MKKEYFYLGHRLISKSDEYIGGRCMIEAPVSAQFKRINCVVIKFRSIKKSLMALFYTQFLTSPLGLHDVVLLLFHHNVTLVGERMRQPIYLCLMHCPNALQRLLRKHYRLNWLVRDTLT